MRNVYDDTGSRYTGIEGFDNNLPKITQGKKLTQG
jgi:hypothetical protein